MNQETELQPPLSVEKIVLLGEPRAETLQMLLDVVQVFDSIILVGWKEKPHYPYLRAIVGMAKALGLRVYWGRRLWFTWPPSQQTMMDVFSAAYYASATHQIIAEAQTLGCGTFLYAEPHLAKFRPWFQFTGFNEQEGIKVRTLCEQAPKVDLIYPASSGNVNGYAWSLRDLGARELHAITYKATREDEVVWQRTPQREGWGTWIGPVSIAQWFELDVGWPIKWVYIPHDRRAAVLRNMAEYASQGAETRSQAVW